MRAMRAPATLAFVLVGVVLIPALLPAASAVAPLQLETQGATTATAQVAAQEAAQGGFDYRITLQQAAHVRVFTRAAASAAVAHTTTWTVDGGASGTTSQTTTLLLDLAAGAHDLHLAWDLHVAPSATYTLETAAQIEASSGQGGSGTTAVVVTVHLLVDRAASSSTTTTTTSTTSTTSTSGTTSGSTNNVAVAQVTGLTAQANEDASHQHADVTLAWDEVAGQGTTYRVFRSTDAAADPGFLVATVSATTFVDPGQPFATVLYYRVQAVQGSDVGPVSASAHVTTPPGPDTTPPSGVLQLTASNPTQSSLSLQWAPASDDRAGPLVYEVHRDLQPFDASSSNLVATTSDPFYTDAALPPGTLVYYKVAARDAAGNLGPFASTSGTTLANPSSANGAGASSGGSGSSGASGTGNPPADTRAPMIRAIQARLGQTVTMAWQVDEPAASQLDITTAGGVPRSFDRGRAVSFEVDVGALPPGVFHYRIAATDSAGNTGHAEGDLTVPSATAGSEVLHVADAALLSSVAAAAGSGALPASSLVLVDVNGDGRVDALRTADAAMASLQDMPAEGLFLLSVTPPGHALALVVVQPGTQQAFPAAAQPGAVSGEEVGQTSRVVTVSVPQKSGWILVSVADGHPGEPIVGVRRSDGSPLSLGQLWRKDGQVHFLDDPAYSYTLVYDRAALASQSSAKESGVGWPLLVGGVAALLVVAGVVFVALRRKMA